MAIIRTAALFETAEFADDVLRGILTTRSIASHSGYPSMSDDVFGGHAHRPAVELPAHLAVSRD